MLKEIYSRMHFGLLLNKIVLLITEAPGGGTRKNFGLIGMLGYSRQPHFMYSNMKITVWVFIINF